MLFVFLFSKTLSIFHENSLETQRGMLDRNPKTVIHSLLEAIFLLESDDASLMYLLPYIDAILLRNFNR